MTPLRAVPLTGVAPCRCGRCRPIATRTVGLDRHLAGRILQESGDSLLLVVGDPRTLAVCGNALATALDDLGKDVKTLILGGDRNKLHASEHQVRSLGERIDFHAAGLPPGANILPVAVGSGTVNDIVKAAAFERNLPYIVVATAASMNGYTSAIAALTVDGLKKTVPSAPPLAVFADPEVLAAAPNRMAVSGLADLLSKPVSSADWKLAHLLWDEPYCEAPVRIADDAVEQAAREAGRIREGDPGGITALFDALLISGMSMAMAGTSSPASGGEHLISHYLDMTAPFEPGGPREPMLHGEQVGAATAVTTRLYRSVLDRSPDGFPEASRAATLEDARNALARISWLPERLQSLFLEQSAAKLRKNRPSRSPNEKGP